ncbi:MAG: L-serine ammonia-lyase, iron-sulfur-dependent, subunit alpha [Bacilli bacterium]|nr:L-serine ammonia-lyase, iron-sulfur-dependent, subunit alpha [Bacilli bacterium]
MKSIKEVFYSGYGPSSSHTIGPYNATKYILNKYQNIKHIKVILYGSLALTGKGHLTDYVIDKLLKEVPHVIFFNSRKLVKHPNTILFEITFNDEKKKKETIISVGGGVFKVLGEKKNEEKELYPHQTLSEIISYCHKYGYSLDEYVLYHEGEEILDYLDNIYQTIKESIKRGLEASGELPGELHVKRKAKTMYENMLKEHKEDDIQTNVAIASFAASEENAAGGLIVVAPTCGSAGVIPGVMKYLEMKNVPYESIRKGFMVAGLIGLLAKSNASISGAEAGCQAEIGVATAMGAAMIATAFNYEIKKIAQSAEVALEHSLGLTCDPVKGYVQIPCIERCAIFALKAINAASIVGILPIEASMVTFDESLMTMYLTGKDLHAGYRETAKKGLAKVIKNKNR